MTPEVGGRERQAILLDLENPDEEVRRLAVERLVTLPTEESIPRLVECLGDTGWRVRKSAVERLISCSESARVTAALIGALADGDNPGRRNSAVEALVGCGSNATPQLLKALDDDDVDVRKLVVDAVAGIGDPAARAAMLEALVDSDANVRAAAADALGVIGGEGVAEALLEAVTRDGEDGLVAFSALRALARLEVSLSARQLAPALDDATLRPAAYALLGRVEDEEAVSCLLKGTASGSRAAREAAMEALLRLLAGSDGPRSEQLVERIRESARASQGLVEDCVERLEEADLATRLVLVQYLGLTGLRECVLPILRAGLDEAISEIARAALESMGSATGTVLDAFWPELDVELRCEACSLLARVGGERGRERLRSALDEPDAELRAAAAKALGQLRCGEALPALVRRLTATAQEDDFDAEEELAALIEALVALARPDSGAAHQEDASLTARAIDLLSSSLEGSVEPVRLAIAKVLGRIGRPQDTELVALLLKDASSQVRRAAVEALARLEPGAASEPLRLALADESPAVRVAAAGALGASENPQATDDLRRLIHDEDERVRAAAVRAIGEQCARGVSGGERERALRLIEHALGEGGVVAMAAAEALQSAGGEEAARACVALLSRCEPELVQAAVSCIGAHGDSSAVEELLPLVPHPNWTVRAEVIQTLAERRVAGAVPPILRRLETEQDEFVRDAILRALKRLEG
jgi:HEAT repeat protein